MSAQIAGTSPALRGSELPVELEAVDLFEGIYELQHGDGTSGADVEYLIVLLHPAVQHPGNRVNMSLRQIDDVDIVAQAGSVGRVVVVAEHGKALLLPYGRLGDERHEVVGHSAGKLADQG